MEREREHNCNLEFITHLAYIVSKEIIHWYVQVNIRFFNKFRLNTKIVLIISNWFEACGMQRR